MANRFTADSFKNAPILDNSNWVKWQAYWKKQLEIADLWQFVDPAQNFIPANNSNDRRYLQTLHATIYSFISEPNQDRIKDATTFKEAWVALHNYHATTSTATKEKARGTSKGTMATTGYYGPLRSTDLAILVLRNQIPKEKYPHIIVTANQRNDQYFQEFCQYLITNDLEAEPTTADNSTGKALRAETTGRRGSQRGRGRDRGRGRGRGAKSRSPIGRDPICNWCHYKGHFELDCRIKARQIATNELVYDSKGHAFRPGKPSTHLLPPRISYPTRARSNPAMHQGYTNQATGDVPYQPHNPYGGDQPGHTANVAKRTRFDVPEDDDPAYGQALVAPMAGKASYTPGRTGNKDSLSWLAESFVHYGEHSGFD
ncbi:hypothetical protein ACJ73_08552 [Blastomyces percursus]|uniref:CCHC-type domain-containing protein n=1 Tax=Blastomyces percursus TaxID=1658174 RepID=A0A1J9QIT8_9EURO|nr:hypothetical protein ACJ73_08552 [Blastomyces percursus]